MFALRDGTKPVWIPTTICCATTVEALAGVLGGCDSMQVGAFDEVIRQPDDFSQRIARNTPAHSAKGMRVGPGHRSGGRLLVRGKLTAELANRAWTLFQEVEKLGGMEAALKAGFPQKAVAATAAEKIKAVNRRRDSIVGVNQYANPKEKPLEVRRADAEAFYKRRVHADHFSPDERWRTRTIELVLQKLTKVVDVKSPSVFDACVDAAAARGHAGGNRPRHSHSRQSRAAPSLPSASRARPRGFEALAGGDANRQANGPAFFFATWGRCRTTRRGPIFRAASLPSAVTTSFRRKGFKTPEDAAKAFAESKARIAVICSTDDNYPALVPPLVAGDPRPRRRTPSLFWPDSRRSRSKPTKKPGVDEFIHVRADALELLTAFHHRLGIEL